MKQKSRILVLFMVIALLNSACGTSNAQNAIEFGSPIGKFRVTGLAGWKRSAEALRATWAESPRGDKFQVVEVDPPQTNLDQLPNPRKFTSNGREITIMDSFSPGDKSLYGVVKVGDHRYLAAFSPASGATVDDGLIKTYVDMLGTLEAIG